MAKGHKAQGAGPKATGHMDDLQVAGAIGGGQGGASGVGGLGGPVDRAGVNTGALLGPGRGPGSQRLGRRAHTHLVP